MTLKDRQSISNTQFNYFMFISISTFFHSCMQQLRATNERRPHNLATDVHSEFSFSVSAMTMDIHIVL